MSVRFFNTPDSYFQVIDKTINMIFGSIVRTQPESVKEINRLIDSYEKLFREMDNHRERQRDYSRRYHKRKMGKLNGLFSKT